MFSLATEQKTCQFHVKQIYKLKFEFMNEQISLAFSKACLWAIENLENTANELR